MEYPDDIVVAVDFGMTGTGSPMKNLHAGYVTLTYFTAVAWCIADSPWRPKRLNWEAPTGKRGTKLPTALAYPKSDGMILAGWEALQTQLPGERYYVAEWFKLHLDLDYIKAAELQHDIFRDHAEIERYYTDFLRHIHAATRHDITTSYTSTAGRSWEQLRIRFEFTWPSNWSDVTKQHYIDCIGKAEFGTCPGHRIFTTYDEATAAVEYASGLTQFGTGETVLICDVGGATTDLCSRCIFGVVQCPVSAGQVVTTVSRVLSSLEIHHISTVRSHLGRIC